MHPGRSPYFEERFFIKAKPGKGDTVNTKQLRYVLALEEEGSFGRAAEALGITQPSLSQYIKKIETETGAALFDRSGGEVRLTGAGRVYVETSRRILALEEQMADEISRLNGNEAGTLTIGTSPFRSAGMMPEAVRRFKELHPEVCVTVEEMTTAELLEKAEHGRFDLCVTMLPVDEHIFSVEPLAREELLLAVPSKRGPLSSETVPGRKYPAVDAKTLDGLPFIMITDSQYMQRALEALCLDTGIRVRRTAVVKSLIAQTAMVAEGVGLALVPSGIEPLFAGRGVTFYSILQELPRREAAIILPRGKEPAPAVKDFLRILHELCG